MLSKLTIRDIVLIEQLEIDFSRGLSVLTGETGAGKSILLDSLALALGARGDGSLVRAGCDRGSVTAIFTGTVSSHVSRLLHENDIDEGPELVLRRVQNSDGRTRAYANGEMIPAGLLKEIGSQLVEIHGQHDDRAMVDADSHRLLLDEYGRHGEQVLGVGAQWSKWQETRRELKKLEARVEEARREADYLRESCSELMALSPEPGEEEELAAQRQRMMQVEKIASELDEACQILGGSASPVPELSSLVRRLERKRAEVPGLLDATVDYLDTALDALSNAHQELEAALRESNHDPRELERTEERLFALRAASRKYSVAVENLPELAVKMADELEMLDHGEEQLAELKLQVAENRERYLKLAGELSKMRHSAAEKLSKAVMAELPALKLEQAEFLVEMRSDEERAASHGLDQVEFWVRTNPGTRAGPMAKVASGGELSRFMLALKVALADSGSAPTLIFDEIDTGVGGAVADAIGQRLERLSENVQVISVTHAPQVAARARGHMLISKSAGQPMEAGEKRVTTGVIAISGEERREEIARMLAGATITDEARAAAERLMGGTP